MRRVPIPLLAGIVFCGHAFNSITLCWLPLRLQRTTQICSSGAKKENPTNFHCLVVNCCQRFQSWAPVGNFLFLREHGMEIKKENRKNQRQSPSCKSSYLQEKLYCLTFLETNKKRKTPFSAKNKNKETLPKREIDGLLRKREIFHHSHSLSMFLFQSNASVKVSTVTDCTREAAATRKSGLNENYIHEPNHGLFSYLINLAITSF